ncbi:tRNA A64-2'-O-ribosylphosphate transferase [Irpex rosettiformis]|uniref:tRNA A64-2'-O-ribosylphosphate transferase n=1 Tax=Irpex rosettiformis TaxID=378272 RepID=A0ACB8UB84_9APHY|nr:tRNA A64-2'-O-ribosylphosphate transferase [Irpex rosettiformis]
MATSIVRDSATSYHAQALAELRKESLDLFNRLHSIAEDTEFVNSVHNHYEDIPIIPNLRCGAWYVNPCAISEQPAYFKSTDGHFNNWSFNLRRPNIHLLDAIDRCKGLIIVDSTRAGKRIPDALSKTVPLWCAVINRAIKAKYRIQDHWDTSLYTPPGVVSAQEHSQIEHKLDHWANQLLHSTYSLPTLERPLRPLWITPASESWPRVFEAEKRTFHPVICVSASRQVEDGLERRTNGFAYVQGSGDDHELWGQGLTPSIFWQHKERLLFSKRYDLQDLVTELVSTKPSDGGHHYNSNSSTPVGHVQGRIVICLVSELPIPSIEDKSLVSASNSTAYVVISENTPTPTEQRNPATCDDLVNAVLRLHLPPGKRGQHTFLDSVLPQSLPFIDAHLARGNDSTIYICCDTGKDASVGVALTALQLFFDDEGLYVPDTERAARLSKPSKKSISKRLQWIISSRVQANPSRATLKRVNEFLMTPASFRKESVSRVQGKLETSTPGVERG